MSCQPKRVDVKHAWTSSNSEAILAAPEKCTSKENRIIWTVFRNSIDACIFGTLNNQLDLFRFETMGDGDGRLERRH